MFILVDIGGTKTRVARTDDLQTFGEPIVFKTPQPYQYALVALVEAVNTALHEEMARDEHVMLLGERDAVLLLGLLAFASETRVFLGAAAGVLGRRRGRCRADLSQPAGSSDRAVSARRRHRHPGAHGGAKTHGRSRLAIRVR